MANEKYDVIKLDTESNPELAKDISRLQDKIDEALDFYYTLRDKHGELGAWEMVEDKLSMAWATAQSPIELLPEEE